MKNVFLHNIALQNYRNFLNQKIEFSDKINLIIGPNGSGKTNILEAISYLTPGRGLKSTQFSEITNYQAGAHNQGWACYFQLESILGPAQLISKFQTDTSRIITHNGSKISAADLSKLLQVIWLTPQMEGIFLGGTTSRRRFFDRIVFGFNATHAHNLNNYEKLLKQRNRLLAEYRAENSYLSLDILEKQMAEIAYKIDSSRQKVLNLLQTSIEKSTSNFPKALLAISPLFKENISSEDFLVNYPLILKQNRKKDFIASRTIFGVHKMDFIVTHQEKNLLAKLCSTGEQKALLVSIIIASIELIKQRTNTTPILLLDELFVHLDAYRKKSLANYLLDSNLQTLLTNTDIIGLEEISKQAKIIKL